MASKIVIINAPLHNIKDKAPYGILEVKEIEEYTNGGWEVREVIPVIPNQSGAGTLTHIQYLVRLLK